VDVFLKIVREVNPMKNAQIVLWNDVVAKKSDPKNFVILYQTTKILILRVKCVDLKIIYFLDLPGHILFHGICLQTFSSEFANQAISQNPHQW